MTKNIVYIGYDPKENQAYEVAKHSILSRAHKSDVRVLPLSLPNLVSIFDRPIEEKDGKLWCPISNAPMSTEFAISRFCIPFLEDKGWCLFVDCDIICLTDITKLFELADNKYAVMVVKHKQETGDTTKMDGQIQTFYKRKNWSSVVLWNCEHEAHKRLTLNDLNTWPGRDLHAFKWLADEEIGELPSEWNHLVGVDLARSDMKIAHYTLGGPWIEGWGVRNKEDLIWLEEYEFKNKVLSTQEY